MSSSVAVLRLFKNGKLIEVKQLSQGQIVIGRNEEAQLVINDSSISPLHAVIEKRDSGYFVSDLGSDAGTLRNGQKVLDEALASGDELVLGDYKIQFSIGAPGVSRSEAPVAPVTPVAKEVESPVPPPAPKVKQPRTPVVPPPVRTGTFAPESAIKDLKQVVKSEKGTVVEVLVAWRERIIASHHYNEAGNVYIGSDSSCDIIVPLLGTTLLKHKLLKIDSIAHVFVTTEMNGEYIEGGKRTRTFADLSRTERMQKKNSTTYSVDLIQGDIVVIHLLGGTLTIYIRYVSETPKPIVAPLLDLTASEVTGVILAIVVAAIFGLYMMVYAPEKLEDQANRVEEPLRKAIVKFNPPKPKKIVKVGSETRKKVEEVKEVEKTAPPSAHKAGKTGQAATLKPSPQKRTTTRLESSKNQGGAVKTGKSGASAKSKAPDPTKMGILSVFGSKGTQSKLSKVYDGAGELTGIAGQATGSAGFKDDRKGDNLGDRLKSTGAGGQGKATVGISGPVTKGRGSGTFGYGSGGIGKKGSVDIKFGGQEEAFVGTIDRDAIRRVILDNINQIKHCYEKELNRSPDLFGKLVLEWDIVEKGRVQRAVVKSNTIGSQTVAKCVVDRLKRWKFPEPPEDQVARVTYPFVFASK